MTCWDMVLHGIAKAAPQIHLVLRFWRYINLDVCISEYPRDVLLLVLHLVLVGIIVMLNFKDLLTQ